MSLTPQLSKEKSIISRHEVAIAQTPTSEIPPQDISLKCWSPGQEYATVFNVSST
ncbi:8622_t:CDS:2 [Paraglomus brasilianum]|uniref:8622_t:CDS:1 n=1 Tax=Paraglomus brasilianum TaxID=144538 RepID=A0A9N8Z248_9GLOM|nr:8622_t:CDS:2 [Paraglomus brasilianum]